MNRIIQLLLLLLIIIGVGEFFTSGANFPLGLFDSNPAQEKCTTRSGAVIYGQNLNTDECEKIEPVTNSVTVFNSSSKNSSNRHTDTTPSSSRFRCDGRQHCSQMTSCDEAVFFLNNCPDPLMDGDYDGIPCENQWC
ncbi:MAG: excalibur calcium-binding domain-containing protein [Pseudomonadota bacterium]